MSNPNTTLTPKAQAALLKEQARCVTAGKKKPSREKLTSDAILEMLVGGNDE